MDYQLLRAIGEGQRGQRLKEEEIKNPPSSEDVSEPAPLPSGKSLTGTERFLIFIIALVIAGAIVVLITK